MSGKYSFNLVVLMGNLTRDPETKYLPSGAAVCEFSLAVNRTWFDKKANEKKQECAFVDCVAWGRTAEVISQYCQKGSGLHVSGYLKQDTWNDKETGQKRSKLRVICDSIQLLGTKGGAGRGEESQDAPGRGEESQDSEEVPF